MTGSSRWIQRLLGRRRPWRRSVACLGASVGGFCVSAPSSFQHPGGFFPTHQSSQRRIREDSGLQLLSRASRPPLPAPTRTHVHGYRRRWQALRPPDIAPRWKADKSIEGAAGCCHTNFGSNWSHFLDRHSTYQQRAGAGCWRMGSNRCCCCCTVVRAACISRIACGFD
jgi:hypothetical protein